jgi:hypothetical protein
VGRVDVLEVVHPDDPHVRAGRDQLEAVLGLAPLEGPQPGPEPDEELGDQHAAALGHPVVAELVEDDRHEERAHDVERGRAELDQRHDEHGGDDGEAHVVGQPAVALALGRRTGALLGRVGELARPGPVDRRLGTFNVLRHAETSLLCS